MSKYLVIYLYHKEYYSVEYTFFRSPPSLDDIRKAELFIMNKNNYSTMPMILNIIKLNDEE